MRERQKAGFHQPRGMPPSGPSRVRWPGLLRQPRNELLQHQAVDDLVDDAFTGQQPSTARVQRSKPLAVLFGDPADPLEDGSLEVVVDQEVLNWQLLRSHLRPP